jgi:hypothetical protein
VTGVGKIRHSMKSFSRKTFNKKSVEDPDIVHRILLGMHRKVKILFVNGILVFWKHATPRFL